MEGRIRAALTSAALNVFVNTKSMQNRDYAGVLDSRANELLAKYVPLCNEVYDRVLKRLAPAAQRN